MTSERPARILVIARGHLADVVTALPALRDLRAAHASAHVAIVVNEYVRGFLEACPFVDEVIYGFQYERRGRLGRGLGLLRLGAAVAGRFDIVIGLHWSPASTPLLALVAGARTRVAHDRTRRLRRLLTHDLGEEVLGPVPNRVLNMSPLAALGIPCRPDYDPIDWLPAPVRAAVDGLEGEIRGVHGGPLALVQLSCHWGCNEWASEKWARLLDHLQERHGLAVVAIGRGEEHEHAKLREVAGLARRPICSLIGRTSVLELAELVNRAALVVASDSALTQLALAQRTPAVIMFGIEEIEANGPVEEKERRLVRALQHWEGPGLAPSPNPHCRFGSGHCHSAFCSEDSSRRRITVAEARAAVAALLATAGEEKISELG